MPTWAYWYCGFIVVSTVFNLIHVNRLKSDYQAGGEILCGMSGVLMFLIAFGVVTTPYPALIGTLALTYTSYWTFHAHKHYLNFKQFKADFHKWEKQTDDELSRDLGSEYQRQYNFNKVDKVATLWFWVVMSIMLLLSIPYLYAYGITVGFITVT